MELEISINERQFLSQLQVIERRAMQAAEVAMNDVVDELIRIASEITPFDKGILTRSHSKQVNVRSGDIHAKVEFSVREGDFNYALWMHEGIYNHGEGTMNRSGTTGWSGKRYYAGRKYLQRPLKGEEQAFYRHFADKVRQVMEGD